MTTSTPKILVFDVNETLLDTTPLKEKVNSLLQNKQGFRIWFTTLLQYSLVDTIVNQYHDLADIAEVTLEMTAVTLGTDVPVAAKKEALALITQLPPHPDVEPALLQMKNAGFRLITLTNSPPKTLQKQLAFAGIDHFFEETLSVDTVKMYKPAIEPYRFAAKKTGVDLAEMMMVAVHGWDMSGAIAAGMKTAFVQRKEQALYPLSQQPTILGKDLLQIAEKLIGVPYKYG